MSAESLAAFRKSAGNDLANLAEEHMQHDLQQSDRDALISASRSISTNTLIGSVVGLALSLLAARRIRANRTAMYNAFRATERPTAVRFADGREEAIPDITRLLQPTTLGDVATYSFLGLGGLFVGGELGLLGGTWYAKRTISKDPEAKKRIETAFRRFRADVLRKQIEELEKSTEGSRSKEVWF